MKRVLKFILWGLLVIIGVSALSVLVALISGSFNPKKVYITNLSIQGVKEYAVISENEESFTGRVDFLPADANQLTLTAKINTGADVLEEIPSITAGEPFTLKYAKVKKTNANGEEIEVVKGGEVEIKFVDSSNNAFVTLKLLVDVPLTRDFVQVTSNLVPVGKNGSATQNSGVLSTKVSLATQVENKIRILSKDNSMLNSYSGSWSGDNSVNDQIIKTSALKKMIYFNSDPDSVKVTKVEQILENNEKYYQISYYSPASTRSDPAKLSVYIYRTYHLQSVFSETLANNIWTALDTSHFGESELDYKSINTFVNSYMYAVCSKNQHDALEKLVNTQNGLVNFNATNDYEDRLNGLEAILDFVFMHFDLNITVANITISNISVPIVSTFNVLMDKTYTIDDLKGLNIGLVPENSSGVDDAVLTGNLRRLEIFATKRHVDDDANDPCDRKNKDGATYANWTAYFNDKALYRDYFTTTENSKTVYYENLGTSNEYLSIVKDEKNNTWTLKSTINTPSTGTFALVFRYRNTDVREIESAIINTTSYYYYDVDSSTWKSYSATGGLQEVTDANTLQLLNDGGNAQYTVNRRTYVLDKDTYKWTFVKSDGSTQTETATSVVPALFAMLNDVYAVSPFTISYTPIEIKRSGENVERFVLNKTRKIYKKVDVGGTITEQLVENLNYGTKQITTSGNNSTINITAQSSTATPEYTTVKWLVIADQNIAKRDGGNVYYKFLPTFRRVKTASGGSTGGTGGEATPASEEPATLAAVTAESTYKYEPVTYKLRNSQNDTLITSIGSVQDTTGITFMELGTDDFSLIALNVFEDAKPLQLFAVVIQTTDTDGTPYMKVDNGEACYYAVAINNTDSNSIQLKTTKYIENLYAFANFSETDGNGNGVTRLSNISNDNTQMVEVRGTLNNNDATIYLSSIMLTNNENNITISTTRTSYLLKDVVCYATEVNGTVTTTKLISDGKGNVDSAYLNYQSDIVLSDAVNYVANEQVALKNYYDTISSTWKQNGYNVERAETSPAISGFEIGDLEFATTGDSSGIYISFKIAKANINDVGTFFMQIYANGGVSTEKEYSRIDDSNGNGVSLAFRLVENGSTGGETGEGGGETQETPTT